ncbi:beta-N-acetylhexosaminidase [Herbiconiux daphne]|uniref:Beta-N-acetylhexosaminidase n=1 Tax=Herbiconiux daphne TaxID=2970914 RepID=A0ABT2GXH7_9MICO|nr:beta-N-acetylhexosaminidase [Herbiconiux daphne]MCS5732664.1 beta-N-acetylhexosaminidase [Herbiconiux daphne]
MSWSVRSLPVRRDILSTLLPGFVGTTLPEWVERMLREGLGGVCLFGENVVSPDQVRALTAAVYRANPDALIAIDEEGGDVTRLFYDRGSPFPGNAVLGRLDDLAATTAVASAVGAELRAVGVNVDFAPDVDINSNPRNPVIGIRSFGDSPDLVARHSAAWVMGLQRHGVAASIKHFPGHGDTAQDSHLALPTVDVPLETLRARELRPFAAAVAAGAMTVMTSHILLLQLDPEQPATFSPRVLQGVLRDELGFDGVIVSDALDMVGASGVIGIPAAAVRALAAGCDLLCIGTKNTEQQLDEIVERVEAAVAGGELEASRIADANARLRALVAAVGASAAGAGEHGALPDADRVAEAFAIDVAADADLGGAGWHVVRVDTIANIAVGVVPWGPFRALVEAGSDLPVHEVDERSWRESIGHIPEAASVLVIGKDNQRRPEVVALIDALRARQPRMVTVDMGWPGDDPAYAQIATFGASALVGEALAGLLARKGVRS